MANGHGGKRPNSGRKSKAEELGLAALIKASWPEEEQRKAIKKLAQDCNDSEFHVRHESRKLLLAYTFGKPTEKHEHAGKDGKDLIPDKFLVEIVTNDGSGTSKKNPNK